MGTRLSFGAPSDAHENDTGLRFGERSLSCGKHPSACRGKPLKALLPVLVEAMERRGGLKLDPVVRAGVLAMSAATIDPARCTRPDSPQQNPGGGSRQSLKVRTGIAGARATLLTEVLQKLEGGARIGAARYLHRQRRGVY
jgi:hypothetical protein